VQDTGRGIAPEHLPHLFDRFYQGDPARAGRAEGAGLGLSIVQSIVDLHGGTIDVDSTPGRGTTITLRFPGWASSDQAPDEQALEGQTPYE
jgi:signal transduction histidine kinase